MKSNEIKSEWVSLEKTYELDVKAIKHIDEVGDIRYYFGIQALSQLGEQILANEGTKRFLEREGYQLIDGWYCCDLNTADKASFTAFFNQYETVYLSDIEILREVSADSNSLHQLVEQLRANALADEHSKQADDLVDSERQEPLHEEELAELAPSAPESNEEDLLQENFRQSTVEQNIYQSLDLAQRTLRTLTSGEKPDTSKLSRIKHSMEDSEFSSQFKKTHVVVEAALSAVGAYESTRSLPEVQRKEFDRYVESLTTLLALNDTGAEIIQGLQKRLIGRLNDWLEATKEDQSLEENRTFIEVYVEALGDFNFVDPNEPKLMPVGEHPFAGILSSYHIGQSRRAMAASYEEDDFDLDLITEGLSEEERLFRAFESRGYDDPDEEITLIQLQSHLMSRMFELIEAEVKESELVVQPTGDTFRAELARVQSRVDLIIQGKFISEDIENDIDRTQRYIDDLISDCNELKEKVYAAPLVERHQLALHLELVSEVAISYAKKLEQNKEHWIALHDENDSDRDLTNQEDVIQTQPADDIQEPTGGQISLFDVFESETVDAELVDGQQVSVDPINIGDFSAHDLANLNRASLDLMVEAFTNEEFDSQELEERVRTLRGRVIALLDSDELQDSLRGGLTMLMAHLTSTIDHLVLRGLAFDHLDIARLGAADQDDLRALQSSHQSLSDAVNGIPGEAIPETRGLIDAISNAIHLYNEGGQLILAEIATRLSERYTLISGNTINVTERITRYLNADINAIEAELADESDTYLFPSIEDAHEYLQNVAPDADVQIESDGDIRIIVGQLDRGLQVLASERVGGAGALVYRTQPVLDDEDNLELFNEFGGVLQHETQNTVEEDVVDGVQLEAQRPEIQNIVEEDVVQDVQPQAQTQQIGFVPRSRESSEQRSVERIQANSDDNVGTVGFESLPYDVDSQSTNEDGIPYFHKDGRVNVDAISSEVWDQGYTLTARIKLVDIVEKLIDISDNELSTAKLTIEELHLLASLRLQSDVDSNGPNTWSQNLRTIAPPSYLRMFESASRYAEVDASHLSEEADKLLTDFLKTRADSGRTYGTPDSDRIHALIESLKKVAQKNERIRVAIPYSGTGLLAASIPPALRENMDLYLIESDPLCAKISKVLNPDATVIQSTLMSAGLLQMEKFDIVMAHIGEYDRMYSIEHPESIGHTQNVTDYAIGHFTEILNPKGRLIANVRHSFLDAQIPVNVDEKSIKKYEARRIAYREMVEGMTHCLGIVRHPDRTTRTDDNGSFDTIVLQRESLLDAQVDRERWSSYEVVGQPSIESSSLYYSESVSEDLDTLSKREVLVNQYFTANSKAVVGKPFAYKYRNKNTVVRILADENFKDYLSDNLDELISDPIVDLQTIRRSTTFNIQDPVEVTKSDVALSPYHTIGMPYISTDAMGLETVGRIGEIEVSADDETAYDIKLVVDPTLQGVQLARTIDFVTLGVCVRECLLAQEQEESESERVIQTRATLNMAYDNYVEKHGLLHHKNTKRVSRIDPLAAQVLAIEYYEKNYETGEIESGKNPIFRERVIEVERDIEDVDSVQEALTVSMARFNEVRPEYIAELVGKDWKECQAEIDEHIFIDPKRGKYVVKDQYLSGDVISKLEEAKIAAKHAPGFSKNIVALERVKPTPLPQEKIIITLGADFIPEEFMIAFLEEYYEQAKGTFELLRNAAGEWEVKTEKNISEDKLEVLQRKTCSDFIKTDKYISELLNQRLTDAPNIKEEELSENDLMNRTQAIRASQEEARRAFVRWVNSDTTIQQDIYDRFNQFHNRFVERTYDGSSIIIPGMSAEFAPRDSQLNAAYRGLLNGHMVASHAPGTGKTAMSAILATMLMKYRGEKSLIVAKPSTYSKYLQEIYKVFPNARVFGLSPERAKPQNRQETMELLRYGKFDFILTTQGVFDNMALSESGVDKVFRNKISEVRARYFTETRHDRSDSRLRTAERAILKDRQKWAKKLKAANKPFLFDELGVDNLIVDECQDYKNYPYHTRHKNIQGLHVSTSQKATLVWALADYLRLKHEDDRGIILMSGTPIAKSLVESYTIMNVVAPSTLKACGVQSLDQFLKVFCELRGDTAPDGRGGVKTVTKIDFHNGAALMALARPVFDFVTDDTAGVEKPNLRTNLVVVKKSMAQRCDDYNIRDRIDKMEKGEVHPSEDNVLVQRVHMHLSATDTRLRYPNAIGDAKLTYLVSKLLERYESSTDVKGTQVVFLDKGTPGGKKYDLYAAIKRELLKHGVKEDEIAFSQDAKGNPDLMAAMEQKIRSGTIRIYFGHTNTAGVGSDYQDRMVAAYMVTVDNRPDHLTQKINRVWREKPKELRPLFPDVDVDIIMTENSEDILRHDRMIDATESLGKFLSGSQSFDSLREEGESSLTQMKQCLWGNIPELKLKNDLEIALVRETARSETIEDNKVRAHRLMVEKTDLINDSEQFNQSINIIAKRVRKHQEINSGVFEILSKEGPKMTNDDENHFTHICRIIYDIWKFYGDRIEIDIVKFLDEVPESERINYLKSNPSLISQLYPVISDYVEENEDKFDNHTKHRFSYNVEERLETIEKKIKSEEAKQQAVDSNEIKPSRLESAVSKRILEYLDSNSALESFKDVGVKVKELFNNRWNKFESNISDLVDSDSPPLRLDMLIAGTEKHYAHTYQPGRFAGRMVNQRELDAEATTHTSMYGKSEFTIRGILCRKVTNREDKELKYHVLDPRVMDGEQRVVHRARSIRALMNILTEDGIKSLKENRKQTIQEARHIIEQSKEVLNVENTAAEEVIRLTSEIRRLDGVITRKQAQVMAETRDEPRSIPEMLDEIKLGRIEPELITLDNIDDYVTIYSDIATLKDEHEQELDSASTLSNQDEQAIEGEFVMTDAPTEVITQTAENQPTPAQ